MEFLVFLLAYTLRRKLDQSDRISSDVLWRSSFSGAHKVQAGRESSVVRGLVIVLIPTLLLAFSQWLLRDVGWSVAAHPLAFVLLIALMGVPGLGTVLETYAASWRRGDMQAAWHHVKDLLPVEDRGAAASPEYMHLALSREFMSRVFERYFVVAFWFVIGGMALAFFSRGLIALRDHWPHAAARPSFGRMAAVVNWLPARLLALTFGLAGDLAGWLKVGRKAMLGYGFDNARSLMHSANGALTGFALDPERFSRLHPDTWQDFGDRSLAAIRGLLNRSMLVWICSLALLVISGVV